VKILVPVKAAALLPEGFVLDGSSAVAGDMLRWELGEWDARALQAAQKLRDTDAQLDGEIVVVIVGAAPAPDVLRACLARGGDRALAVCESELDASDPLTVATVLAGVATREQPDVILCGAQSSDAANAATGVALAGLLELACVAAVSGVAHDGGELQVQRELEGGAVEVLRLSLPALLTVQGAGGAPPTPTLRAIKQARAKPIETLSLSELDLDGESVQAAAGARTLRLLEPQRGEGASMIEGPAATIAARILEILGEELRG
jgi:electron transfer flavoprotein beta subunit